MQTAQTQDARPQRLDGRVNHLWLGRHKAVSKPATIPATRYWRAMRTFFPWDAFRYPGIERLALELAQCRVSVHAVRMWRKGARKPPQWLWSLIAAEADRRIAALEHVRDLAKKEAGLSGRPFTQNGRTRNATPKRYTGNAHATRVGASDAASSIPVEEN